MGLINNSGTITTTSSEQTIFDRTGLAHYAAWLHLHNLASSDSMTFKIYTKDATTASTTRLYRTITYTNAQTDPSVYIPFIYTTEFKVTVTRVAGTDRDITWESAEVTEASS